MNDIEWRVNYANNLLQKLEAVKKGCGGGQIHDVITRIGTINMRLMSMERNPSPEMMAKFDTAVQDVERFLASIVVPETSTQTRKGFLSQLWRSA